MVGVMNSIKINGHEMGKFNFDTVLKSNPFRGTTSNTVGCAGGQGKWMSCSRLFDAHTEEGGVGCLLSHLYRFYFITDQFDIPHRELLGGG